NIEGLGVRGGEEPQNNWIRCRWLTDNDGSKLAVSHRAALTQRLIPMTSSTAPSPQETALLRRGLPRGIGVWGLALAVLLLDGGVALARPALNGHLRLPQRSEVSRRPALVVNSNDGAVLERNAGVLGVRAWAQEPGSCLGPAGQRAQRAAQEAARGLLSEARFQVPAQLSLIGTSELDVRTPEGVACSVEIVVSHVRPAASRRAR
ncbi:MAG: hypothetical protein KC492_27435, partial [Myxococcales bacterium]|nr:hypothetical protein [Myxococcales bacterium]